MDPLEAKSIAAVIEAELRALPFKNTASERAIRRRYSRELEQARPELIFALARELIRIYNLRWIAYELIREHKIAFNSLDEMELEEFGQGINSWWTVDAFARTLSGPAWLNGQISDETIMKWGHSEDLWWRRAALVSTVAWNVRSQGGPGDVSRTFAVCRLLVSDHEDMVVKAMSWALRELVSYDPEAVQTFINDYTDVLAARIKYEVGNKLRTGLKNPRLKKK